MLYLYIYPAIRVQLPSAAVVWAYTCPPLNQKGLRHSLGASFVLLFSKCNSDHGRSTMTILPLDHRNSDHTDQMFCLCEHRIPEEEKGEYSGKQSLIFYPLKKTQEKSGTNSQYLLQRQKDERNKISEGHEPPAFRLISCRLSLNRP